MLSTLSTKQTFDEFLTMLGGIIQAFKDAGYEEKQIDLLMLKEMYKSGHGQEIVLAGASRLTAMQRDRDMMWIFQSETVDDLLAIQA